jgi:hypothetical protein
MKKYSCIIDSLPGKIDKLYYYISSKDYRIGDVTKVEFNNSTHLAFIFSIEEDSFENNLTFTKEEVICSDVFNIDDTKIIDFYVNKYNFGYFEMLRRVIDLNDYKYKWKNNEFSPKKSNKYIFLDTKEIGTRKELSLSSYSLTKKIKDGKILRLEKRNINLRDYTNYTFTNIDIKNKNYISDILKNNYKSDNILIDLSLIDNDLSFETVVSDARFIFETRQIKLTVLNVLKSNAKYENFTYEKIQLLLQKYNRNTSIVVNDHISERSGSLVDITFRKSNLFLQKNLLSKLNPNTYVYRVTDCLMNFKNLCDQIILIGDFSGQKISQILSKNPDVNVVLHLGTKTKLYRKNMVIIKSKVEQEGFAIASKFVNILKLRNIEATFKKNYYKIFKNSVCFTIELTEEIPYKLLNQFQETVNGKIYFRSEVK